MSSDTLHFTGDAYVRFNKAEDTCCTYECQIRSASYRRRKTPEFKAFYCVVNTKINGKEHGLIKLDGNHFSALNAACDVSACTCSVHGHHKYSAVPGITAGNVPR